MFLIVFIIVMVIVGIGAFFSKIYSHKKESQKFKAGLYFQPKINSAYTSNMLPAGMMAIEYIWQIYTVDPSVVKAVQFSSKENLDSSLDVSNYLLSNMLDKSPEEFQGFRNRLIGYIGEQKVSYLLEKHGATIIEATTSNQKNWDFIIDDHLVNVKTVLDVDQIKGTALNHPDVTYFVPEDTYKDVGVENIQPLTGFNHHQINEQFDNTLHHVNGDYALHNFNIHLPILTGLMALKERQRLISSGGDSFSVTKNVMIDTTTKTFSRMVGAKLGGAIGIGIGSLVFMPVIGGIVGATLGSLVGGVLGGLFGKKIKELEMFKAIYLLESLLEKFGTKYIGYVPKIKYYTNLPLMRKKDKLALVEKEYLKIRSLHNRWLHRLFKSNHYIFYEELFSTATQDYQKEVNEHKNINQLLVDIESNHDYKKLALLIINSTELRDILHVDLNDLNKIYAQRRKVQYERYKLYPDKFPLTDQLKHHFRLYSNV